MTNRWFLTCGLLLEGSEVRSLREGEASIAEGYCYVTSAGELFVRGLRIDPYKKATAGRQHDPDRDKKLLVTRREIDRLQGKMAGTGLTLVPVELLTVGKRFKLNIALAKGKKKWDKRAAEKDKSARKEINESI